MRDWNCKVSQSSAWKYTHPADDKTVIERGGKPAEALASVSSEVGNLVNGLGNIGDLNPKEEMGWEYERVIKYNYSKTELSVLVDVISMIKSLAAMISEKEASLAPILRLYMHGYVQTFLNEDIVRLMARISQKGRKIQMQSLKSMQELGGDFNIDSHQSSRNIRHGLGGGHGSKEGNKSR